jgi:hypothetical protein
MAQIACVEKAAVRNKQGCYVGGMSVVSGNNLVKVDWINAHEGPIGDYNAKNPADVNLLRFTISVRDPVSSVWKDPGSASYLTLIPAKADDTLLRRAAEFIALKLQDHTEDGGHASICERLSWLSPQCFQDDTEGITLNIYDDFDLN